MRTSHLSAGCWAVWGGHDQSPWTVSRTVSMCMHATCPVGRPHLCYHCHNFCFQETTTWLLKGFNMRVDVPKALIVSQLPLMHKDAAAFPLPIRLELFKASQDGEQDSTDTCCTHSLMSTAPPSMGSWQLHAVPQLDSGGSRVESTLSQAPDPCIMCLNNSGSQLVTTAWKEVCLHRPVSTVCR